jgi:hypothetical protein
LLVFDPVVLIQFATELLSFPHFSERFLANSFS